jgi:prepilin signal peptidase PulO-like enzyme (type II secretory pathway)
MCNGGEFFLVSGMIIAIFAFLMGLYAGLGGGDVKLLMVIGFIGVEVSRLTDFIMWFAMISLPISLIYGLKKRTLKTQIPLGPALCGALIITLI